MLRQVKLRILNAYLDTKRLASGKEDDDLTQVILADATKLSDRKRVMAAITTPGSDFTRDDLKGIIFAILLQEETHSTPEHRLDEKVIEFEKALVKRAKAFDLNELKKSGSSEKNVLGAV
ncbi:hypothetical protein FRUB_04733 [Fimbriiglobus ruber]|uniref:Uncharacterized protein n=2 Tax=Fimbriiglobus ruber TaxID=1908690 RepID=A0A225DH53_9BACT|nr:hypothetical protein FRUB_04733 [Fimbriiglobus ruber]